MECVPGKGDIRLTFLTGGHIRHGQSRYVLGPTVVGVHAAVVTALAAVLALHVRRRKWT